MSLGRTFEGRDLAEALDLAAAALSRSPEALRYEVVEEGRRGLFGLGARPVRIWVELPDGVAAAGEPLPASGEEDAEDPELEELREAAGRIVVLMGLDLALRARRTAEGALLTLAGRDRKVLLVREGEVLSALQFLLNRMGRRTWPGIARVRLQCEGYRDRRDDEVVDLAREAAGEVARTGRPRLLHPMNPYERRLVHLAVREVPGVTSRSEGDGFLKQVSVERDPAAGA